MPNPTSSNPQSPDSRELLRLAVVARLFERRHDLAREHTTFKETVQEHAKLLGIHVATLERLQNAAKRAGFIKISFNYTVGNNDLRPAAEKFISKLEQPDRSTWATFVDVLGQELRKRGKYGMRFKALHVVRCGPVPGGSRRRVQRFARLAAPLLVDMLHSAKQIGITWGPTLKCVFDACDPSKIFAPDAKIFPLTGATRDIETEPWISSILVQDLEERRGGRSRGRPLTLQGVWSAMPPQLHQDQRKSLLAAMIATTDYATIFGDGEEAGLADSMDTVLTSIGRFENPWGMGKGALARIVDLKRLRQLTFGDVGGVLLPRRKELSRAEWKEFQMLRRSWIGLTAEHLGTLASRAASKETPGVCVLAVGPAKAEVLLSAIERGFVSQAVVDETLALNLARSVHKLVQ